MLRHPVLRRLFLVVWLPATALLVLRPHAATLALPANGWGQTGISSVVNNGYVQFDPSDSAVCYAVVVDNTTNDGLFISAAEYRP